MNLYVAIRDWVDRCWRSNGDWRVLGLPPAVLALTLLLLGVDGGLNWAGFWAFFVSWTAFTFWRWWIFMRVVAHDADRKFDRVGKFKLAREYWDSESASAAAARKKKHG